MPTIQCVELAKRRVLIAFLLLALPCCALGSPGPAAPARPEYTQQMYTKALSNNSTGPSYLLVTVRTSPTAPGRVVCVVAPFLLAAIDQEYSLARTLKDGERRQQIALGSAGRSFTFDKPEAYRNVQPQYTPEILEEARRLVRPMSQEQLIRELDRKDAGEGKGIHAFYRSKTKRFSAYRDALAHACLERGILVDQGDLGGGLYTHRDWPLPHPPLMPPST